MSRFLRISANLCVMRNMMDEECYRYLILRPELFVVNRCVESEAICDFLMILAQVQIFSE